MYTHKQVKNANRRWRKNYVNPPRLIKATNSKDATISGIHLLNPTADELSEAFCRAEHNLFGCIILHTRRTYAR